MVLELHKNSHENWENLAYFPQEELAVPPMEIGEISHYQATAKSPKEADLTPNSLQEIPATTSHGGGGGCMLRKFLAMSSAVFSPENPSGRPAQDTSEVFSEPLSGQFSGPMAENRAPAEFGEEIPTTTSHGGGGGGVTPGGHYRPKAQYFVQVPKKAPGCDI